MSLRPTRSRALRLLGVAGLAAALGGPAALGEYRFATFDATGQAGATYVYALNASGQAAGYDNDNSSLGLSHGFVRDRSGAITTFDVPGSQQTQAVALDASGQVAGSSYSGGAWHGFVRDASGSFSTFNVGTVGDTFVNALNASGQSAGNYGQFDSNGYIRDASGTVTTFSAPGAGGRTVVLSEDDNGRVGGYFTDAGGSHGFVRDPSGGFTTIDVAGHGVVTALNDSGEAAGFSSVGPGKTVGFVRDASGTITTFLIAGSTDIFVSSLNASGSAAGYFLDSDGHQHGFVRGPSGVLTVVDAPGSFATGILAIDDLGHVGGFTSATAINFPVEGFVASPVPEPSSLCLLAAGLGLLLATGRSLKRRR